MIVPDFPKFCNKLQLLFEEVKKEVPSTRGHNASYIPQLDKVDSSLWGLSVCTIDGQRYEIGASSTNFSVQSCIKPLTYCFALEEHGADKVVKHVGREPSGVAFNSLTMNKAGLPQFV